MRHPFCVYRRGGGEGERPMTTKVRRVFVRYSPCAVCVLKSIYSFGLDSIPVSQSSLALEVSPLSPQEEMDDIIVLLIGKN